jgi:para-nitrobenzyl esterase
MKANNITRREATAGLLWTGLLLSVGGVTAAASESDVTTAPVDTTVGKVRGVRRQGVSRFLGIPYGTDTGTHRFQPARSPAPWGDVRDCFAYGAQAPQGIIRVSETPSPGPSAAPMKMSPESPASAVMAIAMASQSRGKESEDCLVLNVFTPEATQTRKRPVMVWLHGGGLAVGSGGIPSTDGDELCRFGDVVVVSLNHRLNALGYLYLGALHEDFADSGNVGQLDIVLALQWVRDNIANFGGDPNNVTIFGQSGGGWKVGTLLAMPPARGLFHKAIEQSGPAVRAVEREEAAAMAERTLAALNVSKADVHKLQSFDARAIVRAQANSESGAPLSGRLELGPTIDGRNLLSHPFEPVATDVSKNIPLMIGAAKDECTMFFAFEPTFGQMTAEQARQRFDKIAGADAAKAYDFYSKRRPNDPPTYWVSSYMTDRMFWAGSLQIAERKASQGAAPVYLYRVDWHAVLANGALRATHGVDMPFVFRRLDGFGGMDGDGDVQRELMERMSQAWINFARSGNPSQAGLQWPAYDTKKRRAVVFDANTRIEANLDSDILRFWSQVKDRPAAGE